MIPVRAATNADVILASHDRSDAAGVNAPSYHAVTALSYNGSGPDHNRARKMIWTIGHSTRALEEFIALLEANGIKLLADVRLLPGSKRYPQFNADALAGSLGENGVRY